MQARTRRCRAGQAAALLLLAVLSCGANAAPRLVPDGLLRAWDPLTLFFDRDVGPAAGGALLDPATVLQSWPSHPGAFTWLDARTLQFRPAEPWPALTRVDIGADGRHWSLPTLLAAPSAVQPAAGSTELAPFDQLTLTFEHPVDVALLARQLRIGLSAAGDTGAETPPQRWIEGAELDLKVAARHVRDAPTVVVVRLPDRVPEGTRVEVVLDLAEQAEAPRWHHRIATAEPFRVLRFGCAEQRYPVPDEGIDYGARALLDCRGESRQLALELSAVPDADDSLGLMQLLRVTPAVDELSLSVADRSVLVSGRFRPDTPYRLSLAPSILRDERGRGLQGLAPSSVMVRFPAQPAFLGWQASSGVVERHGAQHLPLAGRADAQVDLRVHRIEPLARSHWPFPDEPLTVDEALRPPGPGEAPAAFTEADAHIDAERLAAQLRALGSPGFSDLVALPLRADGAGARFGLDLAPVLQRMGLADVPGTYLVGLRRPAVDTGRSWMRVQVTDLALTTVASADSLRLLVTSLASGAPVPGARVRVQGHDPDAGAAARNSDGWVDFIDGRTDAAGTLDWRAGSVAPGGRVMRIVVEADGDTLVVDPSRPPERFADNRWGEDYDPWLQWTRRPVEDLREAPGELCHLFTERPVYRPEQAVHLKGWLRLREAGELRTVAGEATLVLSGPGDGEWRHTLALSPSGAFYLRFDEPDLPAGVYRAHVEYADWALCGRLDFRKEDYQLPEFELRLSGPDRVPLDAAFEVGLTAHYYAGGRAADRPLRWRVTQFPYTWEPAGLPGFRFASADRFGDEQPLGAQNVVQAETATDASGAGEVSVNPALEASAAPRRYVVEATVSGADGRTVTSTREVLGLPAFVLGVRVPGVLRAGEAAAAEVVALGTDGAALGARDIKVRLFQRQWHAQLRAGDFSSGVAKYVTETVDLLLHERDVQSSAEGPLAVPLPAAEAGVYVVELEARDALGRVQTVRTDFFRAGLEPVVWSRPPARVFEVSAARDGYQPGDTATLVLQSPYQHAEALAIVESAQGNRYTWLPVRNGTATFEFAVEAQHAPRLAVHFVLMRGRAAARPGPGGLDPGRPATVAATHWLAVEPTGNRLHVQLQHPARARPGETVDVRVRLADADGHAQAGEVTLWLVDQAVLALGREQRLDPLPDFVRPRPSLLQVHDTRNALFGFLPFEEYPGGGGEDAEPLDLLDNVTVRRRFEPVPFYAPAIAVDASGEVLVRVELPDNLTNFRVRAKAVSGAGRFGHGVGTLAVRVPLVAQPSLPRFVRPGDRFEVGARVRAVDGTGGAARAELRLSGLDGADLTARTLQLLPGASHSAVWSVTVPATASGEVSIAAAVQRDSDGVADAFEVTLPVHADREAVLQRSRHTLEVGGRLELPGIDVPVRAGSLQRDLRVSTEPGLLALLGAAGVMAAYPYACTEQRISQVMSGLALARFGERLGVQAQSDALLGGMASTFAAVEAAIDARGLVAYWPGARGYVSLTAWTVQMLVSAERAGHAVPEALRARLLRSLRQALRSDHPGLLPGSESAERAWALAALTDAGAGDPGYTAELALRAAFFRLENLAQVVRLLAGEGDGATAQVDALAEQLWAGLRTRLDDGATRYAGLREGPSIDGALLPGEVRTLAELLRTAVALGDGARQRLLTDALVARADGDGWGDTNANASALAALADVLQAGGPDEALQLTGRLGNQSVSLHLGAEASVAHWPLASAAALSLERSGPTPGADPLAVLLQASYLPAGSGAEAPARQDGFVVRRDWARAPDAGPLLAVPLQGPGTELVAAVGEVIEERIELVNPADRHHVAVVVPLAAGFEPLNPALATAPPEAHPSAADSVAATYRELRDERAAWFFDHLPAGTHVLRLRLRAVTPGRFVQPPARAELMYDRAVQGSSPGAWVRIGGG